MSDASCSHPPDPAGLCDDFGRHARSWAPKLSGTNRSHDVHHEPKQHIGVRAMDARYGQMSRNKREV